MPTTAEYLNDLVAQKNSLAQTLANNGVEVGENETFSTLVPKANAKIKSSVDIIEAHSGAAQFEYANSHATEVPDYAFYRCSGLTSVELQNATSVGNYAFYRCSNLKTLELTNLISFPGVYTFSGCASLVSLSFLNLTTIGNGGASNTFAGCSNLEVVDVPNLTEIRYATNNGYIFANCTSLRIARFNSLKSVPNQMFNGCHALEEIHMPEATAAANWAFANCSVPRLSLPKMEIFAADNTFTGSKIPIIELPSILSIKYDKTFSSCRNTHTLVLGTSNTSVLEMYLSSNQFGLCSALRNLTVNCTIKRYAGTNLSLKSCPLTLESAKSVISALYDYSGTDEEFAYSLTLSTDTIALLEAEGTTAPGGLTWVDYANSKGWNI